MGLAELKLGFIGAGAMGGSMCKGLIEAGAISPKSITVSDANATLLQEVASTLGVNTTTSNVELIKSVDVVVLAVKPHIVPRVLDEVSRQLTPAQTVISIAAGLTLRDLEEMIDAQIPVIRAMPNTGARVNQAASAFCAGAYATADNTAIATELFNAIGLGVQVEERMMDAVTALSGSGPAYIFMLIEALADGGVQMGLPRAIALALATQTTLGAATMVKQTGMHPAALKDMVTTPAGTTIAGLASLERDGFRAALIDAVEAAANRSAELGR